MGKENGKKAKSEKGGGTGKKMQRQPNQERERIHTPGVEKKVSGRHQVTVGGKRNTRGYMRRPTGGEEHTPIRFSLKKKRKRASTWTRGNITSFLAMGVRGRGGKGKKKKPTQGWDSLKEEAGGGGGRVKKKQMKTREARVGPRGESEHLQEGRRKGSRQTDSWAKKPTGGRKFQ